MNVEKVDYRPIGSEQNVKVKSMGNITEIMYSEKVSRGGSIRKISKNEYVNLNTGEVKKFKHNKSRADDKHNVAKSLKAGRDIINTNVTDVKKVRWLTLTYAENMTDPARLHNDFKIFNTLLRRKIGPYEYITAAEPQGRGAWHLHSLLIFDDEAPFIPNEVIADCWKQGFVKITKLDDVDNVGVYLTAYLGDMELDDVNVNVKADDIKTVDVKVNDETVSKRIVKGARLKMYPPGFHIFRYSKNIKKPLVSRMKYKEAAELVGPAKLTYSKSVVLEDVENDFSNLLTYEYYNKIKK